jgi:hypothetical protein
MISRLVRVVCAKPAPAPEPLPNGVSLRYASWLPRLAGALSGMRGPAAAVTIGDTIIIHPSVHITERLVRHELAHVRQWQANRWTFAFRYTLNHFKYGYHDNPFEVEARAAEASEA